MPYIEEKQREELAHVVESMREEIRNSGELNYLITKLIHSYLELHGLSYSTLNDIGGALNYADKEFYRRVVMPYENHKIKENGDVRPDLD